MGVKWTKQQQKVIDLRNRNILVSAAAGSGKTAVLVERIIQKITDEQSPVDVDRLLIVTFTEGQDQRSDREKAGRKSGKRTSGEAGYVSSQCADHDDTQFLSVCDKGTFSCDRS